MFAVEFAIYHKGCWGSEISLKFPNHRFSSIDCRWVKGNVAHILVADLIKAEGEERTFEQIKQYLKQKKHVQTAEIISQDKQKVLIRTLTKHSKKHQQFSDIFFNNHLFPIAPIQFEGKYEHWTLASTTKANITAVYTILKKKYQVRILSLKEENITSDLTPKQKEILHYAQHLGYYEWPRKKSATEISNMIHMPKTVFLSHLRKAEKKIIKQYVGQNSRP